MMKQMGIDVNEIEGWKSDNPHLKKIIVSRCPGTYGLRHENLSSNGTPQEILRSDNTEEDLSRDGTIQSSESMPVMHLKKQKDILRQLLWI